MHSSADLFLLIKGLSKSEKIYFKKFSSLHAVKGGKNYVKLFNEIDAQAKAGKYDETRIKKKFKDDKFIKQLHSTKNYLHNLILKSLKFQHYADTNFKEVREGISSMAILLERGLVKQSIRMHKKVKAEAYKMEMFHELLKIFDYEFFLEGMNYYKTGKDMQKFVLKEAETVMRKLRNRNQYGVLSSRVYSIRIRKDRALTSKDLDVLNKIMSHPLMQTPAKALSYGAKKSYYGVKTDYFYITGEKKKNFIYLKNWVRYMERHPEVIARRRADYISILNNYLIACLQNNNYNEFRIGLGKVKAIYESRVPDKARLWYDARVFRIYYSFALDYSISTGNIVKFISLEKEASAGLELYKTYIDDFEAEELKITISRGYLISEKYESSLKLLNAFLNKRGNKVYEDLYASAVVLNLINHYELGNGELLPYLLQSASVFFGKKNAYALMKEVAAFIRKLSKTGAKEEYAELYDTSMKKIGMLEKENSKMTDMQMPFFKAWMESKAYRAPLSEILKKRNAAMIG